MNTEYDKKMFYYDHANASFNQYDKPLYRQCEDVHTWIEHYPDYKVQSRRCGGDAMWIVTSYLPLSEKWNSKHVCDLCLSHYMERYGKDKFVFEG